MHEPAGSPHPKSLFDGLESGHRQRDKSERPRRRRTFLIEPLEERQLLSTRVWDGGGGDNKWSTAANWVGSVAPTVGDDLQFAGTARTGTQNDFAAGTSFGSIEFASSNFSLAGNSLTVTNGITVDSGVAGSTIALGVALGGTVNVNVVGTTLTMSGALTGSGGLQKSGTGTLTLSATNTYSGGTTLNAGTVNLTGTLTNTGSTLNLGAGTGT
jgi:fibronectin-binding autotransporter adhesin